MELLNPFLFIKTSTLPNSGQGLFTKISIPKGAVITEHTGTVTRFKDADHSNGNPYIFYVTRNHVIDARHEYEAPARYANDAAGLTRLPGLKNNAEYVVKGKRVFIAATRRITAGEEIFVAYGREYWDLLGT